MMIALHRAEASEETKEIASGLPGRISQITVFVSITLIIVLILVIAHVIRLVVGMQKAPKQEAPSAIVIKPKEEEKPKKEAKTRKKTSLACKHRSNYNLPSKLMMLDVDVEKLKKDEVRKKKEKEMELANAVKNISVSAPPSYQTITPSPGPAKPLELTVPPVTKPDSSQKSQPEQATNAAKTDKENPENDKKSGSTIVSTTLKSETNATPTTTSGKV